MQALETSRQEETLIRLPRGGVLATVEDYTNGLMVKSERIKIDNLIFSLMAMVDEADIRNFLIKQGHKNFSLLEIFGPMIQDSSSVAELDQVFELFLARFGDQSDRDIMLRLFETFAAYVDIASLNGEGLNHILQTVLKQVEGLNDSSDFDTLFLTLLSKVNISKADGAYIDTVLRTLLERIDRIKHKKMLFSLFTSLSKRLDKQWIFDLVAPDLSRRRVSSPLLPRNCVLYQENGDGSRVVAIEIEKQKFNVQFGSTLFQKVGHPKMIFVFLVTPKNGISTQLLTIMDKVISQDSKVYYYPFSNVSGELVPCWPELRTLSTEKDFFNNIQVLSTLPYLFLNSPSNNDLFRGENLRELFAKLTDTDFDESILEYTGKRLSEVMSWETTVLSVLNEDEENDEWLDEEEQFDQTA